MWNHVELQMRLPGGLAWKREDWVEHMHQVTNRLRTQFSTTKNRNTRSTTMAQAYQQNTHPESNAWEDKVTGDTAKGLRKEHVLKEESRKRSREEARMVVIEEWEVENGKRASK